MEVKYKEATLLEDLGMFYPKEGSKRKVRYGLYKCGYCGKEFRARMYCIKSGHTRSCGCLSGKKHGLTLNRFYKTWTSMMYRCNSQKNIRYKDYGGRGITVCDTWLNVETFIEWAESTYIEGYTLDRIDNDKGYNPDNCRWADATTQAINQGFKKNNTSGFVGVNRKKGCKLFTATIGFNYEKIRIGSFKTLEEAVQARDNYIIENNLPHKLSTEYKKE
jgi:hypothetical protein